MTHRIERDIADLIQQKVTEFADWCGKEWTITPEVWAKDKVLDTKPEGYREGYNAALEGLGLAVEQWMESGG